MFRLSCCYILSESFLCKNNRILVVSRVAEWSTDLCNAFALMLFIDVRRRGFFSGVVMKASGIVRFPALRKKPITFILASLAVLVDETGSRSLISFHILVYQFKWSPLVSSWKCIILPELSLKREPYHLVVCVIGHAEQKKGQIHW